MLCVACSAPDQQPRRINPDAHLGKPQLHGLKFDDRLAKLLALLHILKGIFQRPARLRQRHGRVAATFKIEGLHQFAKASRWDNDVVERHAAVVEVQIG